MGGILAARIVRELASRCAGPQNNPLDDSPKNTPAVPSAYSPSAVVTKREGTRSMENGHNNDGRPSQPLETPPLEVSPLKRAETIRHRYVEN